MRLGATGAFLAVALVTSVLAGGVWPVSGTSAARALHRDAGGSAFDGAAMPPSAGGAGTMCFIPGGSGERNEAVAIRRQLREEQRGIGPRPLDTPVWSQMSETWRQLHGVIARAGPAQGGSGPSGHRAERLGAAAEPASVRSVTGRDGPSQAGGVAAPARRSIVACQMTTGLCATMFEGDFVEEITAAFPGARFTASVHDHRTGCAYGLNPDLALTTASVIKAQVLAGILLAAQEQARGLTAAETADVELMMHYSHNTPPTSRLYVALGGATGMEALDGRFGVTGTSHTARYGATISTAEDRTVLVEQLLIGGGPLDAGSVRAAWDWMSAVSVVQSWGVTAGLPAGYDAALKNGFYPSRGAGWRAGTTGAVRDPSGGVYAMTVLTDRNPDETAGIALVEAIAGHINAALTVGSPAARPVDGVSCVESRPGWSWGSAAAALGEVDRVVLRRLNGGEASPLTGQRVCLPHRVRAPQDNWEWPGAAPDRPR